MCVKIVFIFKKYNFYKGLRALRVIKGAKALAALSFLYAPFAAFKKRSRSPERPAPQLKLMKKFTLESKCV